MIMVTKKNNSYDNISTMYSTINNISIYIHNYSYNK